VHHGIEQGFTQNDPRASIAMMMPNGSATVEIAAIQG
jgi:hypothetical protein